SAICWAIFFAIWCSAGVVAGTVMRTPAQVRSGSEMASRAHRGPHMEEDFAILQPPSGRTVHGCALKGHQGLTDTAGTVLASCLPRPMQTIVLGMPSSTVAQIARFAR